MAKDLLVVWRSAQYITACCLRSVFEAAINHRGHRDGATHVVAGAFPSQTTQGLSVIGYSRVLKNSFDHPLGPLPAQEDGRNYI